MSITYSVGKIVKIAEEMENQMKDAYNELGQPLRGWQGVGIVTGIHLRKPGEKDEKVFGYMTILWQGGNESQQLLTDGIEELPWLPIVG